MHCGSSDRGHRRPDYPNLPFGQAFYLSRGRFRATNPEGKLDTCKKGKIVRSRKRCTLLLTSTLLLGSLLVGTSSGFSAAAEGANSGFSSVAELQEFVSENPDQFSGIYFDEINVTIHVNTVPQTQEGSLKRIRESRITPGLANAGIKVTPRIAIDTVARNDTALRAILNQITTSKPWTSATQGTLVAWGIDPKANKVRVGLAVVTPEIERLATQLFGDGVYLVSEERGELKSKVTRLDSSVKRASLDPAHIGKDLPSGETSADAAGPPLVDSEPYAGGDRMWRIALQPDGDEYLVQCTAAFKWDLNGTNFAMSSAGHCGALNKPWTQGYLDVENNILWERYSKPHAIEKKNSPRAAS